MQTRSPTIRTSIVALCVSVACLLFASHVGAEELSAPTLPEDTSPGSLLTNETDDVAPVTSDKRLKTATEYDRDGDGLVDARVVYEYNEAGKKVREIHDEDADGFGERVSQC